MADFVWVESGKRRSDKRLERLCKLIINPFDQLIIYGNEGTFNSTRESLLNNDFLFVLGHCYYPGKTLEKTLTDLLNSFTESNITEIKSNL